MTLEALTEETARQAVRQEVQRYRRVRIRHHPKDRVRVHQLVGRLQEAGHEVATHQTYKVGQLEYRQEDLGPRQFTDEQLEAAVTAMLQEYRLTRAMTEPEAVLEELDSEVQWQGNVAEALERASKTKESVLELLGLGLDTPEVAEATGYTLRSIQRIRKAHEDTEVAR